MKWGSVMAAIWRPEATSYTIRIDTDAVRFPKAGEDLDTTRAYYPAELATMLAEAIEDDGVGGVTSCSASIHSDTGYLTITTDEEIEINWTHAETTIPYLFGFDADEHAAAAVDVRVSDYVLPGIWLPSQPPEDPADRADVVRAVAESLSGVTRTQRFANSRRKRDLVWRFLPPSEILEDEASDPHNHFDYLWAEALSFGRAFRVYDQAGGHREYQVRPGSPEEPYVRNGTRAYFWDVTVLARRTTAPGVDGSEETVPVIDTFTVDASSSATVRAGASVTFGWTVTGADTVEIDEGVGAVTPAAGGTQGWTSVEGATVYTLTATNGAGSVTAQVTVTGVRQVLSAFDPRWSYWASDLSGTSLPARGIANGDDIDADALTRSGAAPTTGISTSGLASLALPAALVDQAWRAGGTANNDAYADPTLNASGASLSETCHIVRVIGNTASGLVNGRRLWGIRDTNNDSIHMLWVTTGSVLRVTVTRGGAATNFDVAGVLTADMPFLIDWIYDQAGGSGGEARAIIRINGVEHLNTATAGSAAFGASTLSVNGNVGWACQPGNANVSQVDNLSLQGRNLTAYTDFPLATHQLDAEALGLYTPP